MWYSISWLRGPGQAVPGAEARDWAPPAPMQARLSPWAGTCAGGPPRRHWHADARRRGARGAGPASSDSRGQQCPGFPELGPPVPRPGGGRGSGGARHSTEHGPHSPAPRRPARRPPGRRSQLPVCRASA